MTEAGRPVFLATMLGLEGWDPDRPQAASAPRGAPAITQFRIPDHDDILPAGERFQELDAYSLGVQAMIYGYGSVALYRGMVARTQAPDHPRLRDPGSIGFNRFRHGRVRVGHPPAPDDSAAGTPNPDIVTSDAWLDLSEEPAVFTVPEMSGRYYTACFQDLFANATNIGRRTYGTGAGRFAIVPPGWTGDLPEELTPFHVSTRYLRVLLQISLEGLEDMPAVQALQEQFSFLPLCVYCGATARLRSAELPAPAAGQPLPPLEFYRLLADALRAGGLPDCDKGLVSAFARFGLRLDRRFEAEALPPAVRRGLVRAYDDALAMIEESARQIGQTLEGWTHADLGMYGRNYLQRAAASRLYPAANVKEEALAFTAVADREGAPLDGGRAGYRIRFAPGELPPVNAFWSLALTDRRTDRPFENDLRRYTIGSRRDGLVFDADGGLELLIQENAPANGQAANWLPAPGASFSLVLRTYQPRPAILRGDWTPPPVVPLPRTD
ncbi:DUF1254 domain-containing protein [Algihabitans albus]|uniref:DUF1254 domain-containing protein n=1 Tax=Algihabitans albus TaxID=2164067 RepID=UPI0013C3263F|nr:DUF1254 domain-containing protein [Algihabitans albus]